MAKAKEKTINSSFCAYCGKPHVYHEFIRTTNKIYMDKCIPYCKEALKKMYADYYKQINNDKATIYYLCAISNLPFLNSVYENYTYKKTNNKTNSQFYMNMYVDCLNEYGNKRNIDYNDFSESDTTIDDILNEDGFNYLEELDKLLMDWGEQEVEDYKFLEEQYQIYSENKRVPPAMEQTLRFLCITLLEIRQKKLTGEDTSKLEDKAAKYYKNLRLDNFTELTKTDDEKILEISVAKIEKTRPAFHFKDKERYVDFQGFDTYFENHITRPIKNVLLNQKEYKIKKDKKKKDKE